MEIANGLRQIEGSDYSQTFSPMVKANSVWMVLLLAVTNGWVLNEIDISNAFLHRVLDERIVVTQPSEFEDKKHPYYVLMFVKLKKSLYILKHSRWDSARKNTFPILVPVEIMPIPILLRSLAYIVRSGRSCSLRNNWAKCG